MTATIDSLRRRVATMRAELDKRRPGRDWVLALEEGDGLSPELEKQLGPHDQVIIRYYPKGYLGIEDASTSGQTMSCFLPGPKGKLIPYVVRQYGVDISRV